MSTPCYYKDRPAIAVDTGTLTAVFLPEDGGKFASLQAQDGFEYLCQAAGADYRRLTVNGSYIEAECSGWDDMFPTIDPCEMDGFAPYPDHGEVCRLPLTHLSLPDGERLQMDSRQFPVTFSKEIRALPDGGLSVEYTLRNNGSEPFPCLWAGHIMLQAYEGAKLITPYAPDAPVRRMFGPTEQPRDRLTPRSDAAYKFYYTDPIPSGFCGCHYPDRKETLLLEYDPRQIPWLAIWLNNGEFKGLRNLALEPCTAPYDRPDAVPPEQRYHVPPHSCVTFAIHIHIIRED